MNVEEIVFDNYVKCPLCKEKLKSLSGTHLQQKHGYTNIKEFKLEFGIPMSTALIAHDVRKVMQQKGKRRRKWFKENVMPIGIEQSRKGDLVPKELRKHSGALRKGKSWIPIHVSEMKSKGWLDLHEAASLLGIAYNYARKCATDGRLKTKTSKGVRFTKVEWVEEAKKLLQVNREKYRPDLLR